jgi:hypothetical protein
MVAPEYAFDLGGGDEQKCGTGVHKATDQPGQAMQSTLGRARVTQTARSWPSSAGILVVITRGEPRLSPAFDAALKRICWNAGMMRPSRRALAELGASLPDHNGRMAGEFAGPPHAKMPG